LREWIERQDQNIAMQDPDLNRMIEWARSELAKLEAILDPVKLTAELRTRKLFTEVDELHDPLGEPPRCDGGSLLRVQTRTVGSLHAANTLSGHRKVRSAE